MSEPARPIEQIRQFVTVLGKHRRLCLMPAVVLGCLAVVYVAMAPQTWNASQAMLVRDEAAGSQGRFDNTDAMKNAQETIQELARNNAVVSAALKKVGPPPGHGQPEAWPSQDDVSKTQDAITVSAPKGLEFGKTEVIHLSVTAGSQQRAIELAASLFDALESHLKDLRDRKAQSVVDEVRQQVGLAKADLQEATGRLEALESGVGSDLGELRNLNDSGRGDSNLRMTMTRVKDDLGAARTAHAAKQQQLELLRASQGNDDLIVSMPNELLQSRPDLARLKDGLVDMQLRTAEILGKTTADHPLARAAIAAEQEVRDNLIHELETATLGLDADLKVSEARIANMQRQLDDVSQRLDRLAELRARYGNLVNEVRQSSQILDGVGGTLARAQAARAAARSSSLITRLDTPQTGTQPIGPGKATVVLGGVLGGLLVGVGLVVLCYAPFAEAGRRWTDRLKFGRRAADRSAAAPAADEPGRGRRAEDATTTRNRRAGDAWPARDRRAGDARPAPEMVLPPPAEPLVLELYPEPTEPLVTFAGYDGAGEQA